MPSARTPHRILFVCMGNLCRSPIAEGVFRAQIEHRGVASEFEVDSAGTGGWHAGEPPDRRAAATAAGHGVKLDGRARQVRREDFKTFDAIVCMDEDNRDDLLSMGAPAEKTRLLLEFDEACELVEVPDPYYGGRDGFELVFKLVDAACAALLDRLLAERADR